MNIRHNIQVWDELHQPPEEDDGPTDPKFEFGKLHLGAPQRPSSFEMVEGAHQKDAAFNRFRLKLAEFVNKYLLPSGSLPIRFRSSDMVGLHVPDMSCSADIVLKLIYFASRLLNVAS